MSRIKTIQSETELRKIIVKKFTQERVTDQTAFYLNEGAELYYNPTKKTSGANYDYPKIAQMLKNILNQQKGGKAAIISLGCGNCGTDKVILEHLQELGYDIPLFGVDSSMDMLYKAKENLSNTAFETHLICGHFGTLELKEYLDETLEAYDLKIFLFLGNTFGNLHQGHIAEVLEDLLDPGDHLLLDVAGVETMTTVKQAQLFERYLQYIDNQAENQFFLQPIKTMGVTEECGRLTLETAMDNATQAIAFKFGFRVHTLTRFNLDKRGVTLGSNEHVSLYRILIYDLQELVKFLEEREFVFQEQLLGNVNNQLVNQLIFKRQ